MGHFPLDTYFMNIAQVVAQRTTCIRRAVGAIIVDGHGYIISTGYNGAASHLPHCTDVGCRRDHLHIPSGTDLMNCEAVHAEANAIIQCAVHGTSTVGGTLYCTHAPCAMCTKMIINAGIKRVVYRTEYPNMDEVRQKFNDAGIEFYHLV